MFLRSLCLFFAGWPCLCYDATSLHLQRTTSHNEATKKNPVERTVGIQGHRVDVVGRVSPSSVEPVAVRRRFKVKPRRRKSRAGAAAAAGPAQCDSNPCLNKGQCALVLDSVKQSLKKICYCATGFYGEFCDYDAQGCQTEPCLHNSECVRSTTDRRGFQCICTEGFTGDRCEIKISMEKYQKDNPEMATSLWPMVQGSISLTVFVVFVCVICCLACVAFSAAVESTRKARMERYRALISVGYLVDFPEIQCCLLSAETCRFLSCLFCYICPCCTCEVFEPDDDDEIQLPPYIQRDYEPCVKSSSSRPASTQVPSFQTPRPSTVARSPLGSPAPTFVSQRNF